MKLGKYSRFSIAFAASLGSFLILISLLIIRLEIIVRAEGRVMPYEEYPLFAPEDAVIKSIAIEQGASATNEQRLIELQSETLYDALLERRHELHAALREQALLDFDAQAWAIRPGTPELIMAPKQREMQGRIVGIQRDLMELYEQIREKQAVSRLDLSLREIETLRAEWDLEQARSYAQWHERGLSEVEGKRRARAQEFAAQRVTALEEDIAHIEERIQRLTIRAPAQGIIATLDHRHEGASVKAGERLGVLAYVEPGYIARVFAPPRNIDLVKPGSTAVLTSDVFDSLLEGYIEGTVLRVAPDTHSPTDARYEIDIRIDSSPYPLVLGSPVQCKILAGRRTLIQTVFKTAGPARPVSTQEKQE